MPPPKKKKKTKLTGRKILEFFCEPLHADNLLYLGRKKNQVAFTVDIDVEYKIWRVCISLFSCFANNLRRQTHA